MKFLGAYLKPYVKYIDKRTKGNFYNLVHKINSEFGINRNDEKYLLGLVSSINSYLGTMIHFSSFKLRKKILMSLDPLFYSYYMTDKKFTKVLLKEYHIG